MARTIALLMAGGKGTRLRPLTVTIPKPMLPVGSRAILEIILRQVRAAGVRQIYVSIGYRGYLVRSFLRELDLEGVQIDIVEEDEPLGTAGPLALLPADYDHVFLMNGDVLTRAPMDAAIASHEQSGHDLTMLVHRHPVTLPYGLLEVEGDQVTGIREKPTVEFKVATGMYVIRREVIEEHLVAGERQDMPDLINALIGGRGTVGAYEFGELWTDVADLADFEKINLTSDEWEDL